MEKQLERPMTQKSDGTWEYITAGGEQVVIKEGTGDDAIQATKEMDGKSELMLPILMSRLVTINGQPKFPDEFKSMRLKDYMELMNNFQKVNF